MLGFRYIHVTIWPDMGWRVHWFMEGIKPDQTIDIYRSDAETGPFELIDTVSSDVFVYFDDLHTRGFWKLYWWKLIVKDDQENVILESKPISHAFGLDRVQAEVVRQHELRLRPIRGVINGWARVFAVYKRRTYGTPCHFCVDPDTQNVFIDKCPQCRGVRYLQGWMNPAATAGYFRAPFEKATVHGQYGKSEESRNTLCTGCSVILEPGNYLAERDTGIVWRVNSGNDTSPGGRIITQNVEVERVAKDQIESDLTYPSGLVYV